MFRFELKTWQICVQFLCYSYKVAYHNQNLSLFFDQDKVLYFSCLLFWFMEITVEKKLCIVLTNFFNTVSVNTEFKHERKYNNCL